MRPTGLCSFLSGFDKLAGPYRWLEYLTFGPMLMRTRLAFLPEMLFAKRALLLGDGDGRFCAALLCANRSVCVDAVDGSPAMLCALRRRTARVNAEERVHTYAQSVLEPLPARPFDLVCTHFLLDCLRQDEVERLAQAVGEKIGAGYWVVSEFAVPHGPARWPAVLLVAFLYRSFGLLTGLPVRQLPRHDVALRAAGFLCVAVRTRLFGMLRSELWRFTEPSRPPK